MSRRAGCSVIANTLAFAAHLMDSSEAQVDRAILPPGLTTCLGENRYIDVESVCIHRSPHNNFLREHFQAVRLQRIGSLQGRSKSAEGARYNLRVSLLFIVRACSRFFLHCRADSRELRACHVASRISRMIDRARCGFLVSGAEWVRIGMS